MAQFADIRNISGITSGNQFQKNGILPTIDGHEIACGVSFMGISRECNQVTSSFPPGSYINAKMTLIGTMTGIRWVVVSARWPNGTTYETTTEALLKQWNESSDALIKWLPLGILFLFSEPLIIFGLLIRFSK